MKQLLAMTLLSGLMLGATGAQAQEQKDAPGAPAQGPGYHLIKVTGPNDTVWPIQVQANVDPGAAVTARTFVLNVDGKTEKAAFLGISTSRAPSVLREQLKLKNGLVVDVVEPKSPAEVAGLKRHDVLEKLNDQLLINPAQLAELVRMQKPGESVTLTILHAGERQTLTAKLEEREVMALQDEDVFFGPGMTPAMREMPAMPALPDGMGMPGKVLISRGAIPPGMVLKTEQGPNGPRQMIEVNAAAVSSDGDIEYTDDQHKISIKQHDGHTFLKATDKDGKPLFDGPIDTPEQRAMVPKEIAKKLDDMQNVRIQMQTNIEKHATEKPRP